MDIPFFYCDELSTTSSTVVLNEETSRHIVQVLRMAEGEKIKLTDGQGNLFSAEIIHAHKKKAEVKILSFETGPAADKKITIAISLVKNNNRFEWFLEKATEIAVTEIIPLICERTEKQHFRYDRMKAVMISAMIQSQQAWLPTLREPTKFSEVLNLLQFDEKFIAHCDDDNSKIQLMSLSKLRKAMILIGPEGDFSNTEIKAALENNFKAVALGRTRLRTETAGVVAASILCNS